MSASDPQWRKKVELFRSRFFARDEIFSINKTWTAKVTDPLTGVTSHEEKKSIMPACENYGNHDKCLIIQRKGGCLDCSNRVFQKLTDEWVWKHLSGDTQVIMFMLREEGIRFGACDFDKGNVFEDAKAVRDFSLSLGIPCYIANSNKKGYHVYWFFKDFVPPMHFSSFIRYVYEQLGFWERYHANPQVGMPEVFPKQTKYDHAQIGNGIRVPMRDNKMREGRNSWVDDQGMPIPYDKQWQFLEETKYVLPLDFENVLVQNKIEILQAPASKSRQHARKMEGKDPSTNDAVRQYGDFNHIVEGCPAMREYWAKDDKGEYVWDKSNPKGLFHAARLASMTIALSTKNGAEQIKARWPTPQTTNAIHQALNSEYTPVTCKWMQENGVCHVGKHPRFGDHCMKKLPPVEYENGLRKVNPDNLSEDQWPEPSPIRYATDRNLTVDEVIERLGLAFKAIKEKAKPAEEVKFDPDTGRPIVTAEFLPDNPQERIAGLFRRASYMEEADQAKIEDAIRANKWMLKKDLDSMKKRIKKEIGDEKVAEDRKSFMSWKFDNSEYFVKDGRYVKITFDARGNRQQYELTNFVVEIQEEIVSMRLDDRGDIAKSDVIEDRQIQGVVIVNNQRIAFQVPYTEWFANSDSFFKTLQKYAGSSLIYKRSNYDDIRNCISHFSEIGKKITRCSKQTGHFVLSEQDLYLMPSVMVDKDQIKPNNEYRIQLKNEFVKDLDFKILEDKDFKDICTHLITDYFNCNKPIYTMTTFAHAMSAAITPQVERAVGFNKAPILWLGGGFGGGKSFVAETGQFFFGEFKTKQSAGGSAKAKINSAGVFRHSLMLVDDYKQAMQDPTGRDITEMIQNIYDRSSRPAMTRSGEAREHLDKARGLAVVTGEDYPVNEASALSRIMLIDTELKSDRDVGARVLELRHQYCGFTPRYIRFVYNLTTAEISDLWFEYYDQFIKPVATKFKKEGADRVCENLALNMVAFKLAMDMMVAEGAIPETMNQEMCRIHQHNLETIRSGMLRKIRSSRGSEQFLDALKEALQTPARWNIFNWPGQTDLEDGRNPEQLGFWRSETPELVYIYPKIAHSAITTLVGRSKDYLQKSGQIARLLHEDGYLDGVKKLDRDEGRYTVSRRGPNGSSVRVWALKLEAIGLELKDHKNAPQAAKDAPKKVEDDDDSQADLAVL